MNKLIRNVKLKVLKKLSQNAEQNLPSFTHRNSPRPCRGAERHREKMATLNLEGILIPKETNYINLKVSSNES